MAANHGLIESAWESYAAGLLPGNTRKQAPLFAAAIRMAFYAGAAAAHGYEAPLTNAMAASVVASIDSELDRFDDAVKRGEV